MTHYGTTQSAIKYPYIVPEPILGNFHVDAANTDSLERNSSNQVTRWNSLLPSGSADNSDLVPWPAASSSVVTNSVFHNGLPTVTFTNGLLIPAEFMLAPTVNPYNCLISGVARTRSSGSQRCWMSTGQVLGMSHGGTPGAVGWGVVVEDVEWWLPTGTILDTFHLQTYAAVTGNASLRLNGTAIAFRTVAPNSPQPGVWLGGDQYATVITDICEVIIVTGAWTIAERDQIENYLRIKWSV